jgi:hypothetical protein
LFGDLGSLHAKRATRRFGQMSDYPLPFRGSSGSFNVLFWQRFAWHLANDLRFIALELEVSLRVGLCSRCRSELASTPDQQASSYK